MATPRSRRSTLPLRALCLAGWLGFAAALCPAEPITLTDVVGRTIRAELVSLKGDVLTIRRDDGREFKLELNTLIDDDQTKVRAWQATQPAEVATTSSADDSAAAPDPKAKPKYVPDLKKLTFTLSRYRSDSTTLAKWEGYSHKHEMWGYSIQIFNRNLHPMEAVRVEYNLFARTYYDSGTPSLITGAVDLSTIADGRSETAKTKTAEVCKQRSIYSDDVGGELRGIWVKLYFQGELVSEQLTPSSLKNTVEWTRPEGSIAPR